MIQVEVTPDILIQAKFKAQQMGTLQNSITHGMGNISGFIGEFLVQNKWGGNLVNTYDYDLVLPNGTTVDIKTKRCTSAPKDYYECSIAKFNTKQKCDIYAFVRVEYVNDSFGRAWLLGWYPKKEYLENARFLERGRRDGDNGFIVKADCFNMEIRNLRQF